MPETAFLGAQIAPKSDSRGPTPKGRGRDGRGGPRKIVHPEKFLRIGPSVNRHSVYTEPKDDDAAWRGQNNQRAINDCNTVVRSMSFAAMLVCNSHQWNRIESSFIYVTVHHCHDIALFEPMR